MQIPENVILDTDKKHEWAVSSLPSDTVSKILPNSVISAPFDFERIPLFIIFFPPQDFDNVTVEYVTLPGWRTSIADCRSFAALPEKARSYVEEVERLLGVPGSMSSCSPSLPRVPIK